MANTDRELCAAEAALKSRNFHVSLEWLGDCVEFFRSSNQQYSFKELEDFVVNQWLLVNLRDMKVGSLPPNLSDQRKIILNGKYACQVEYSVDIGHSAYSQIQNIRREDISNQQVEDSAEENQAAWKPKSNRMIQLSLCDGLQEIKAVEYQPIPKLKTDIIPGAKIVLVGPMEYRKGIVLLKEQNLIVCGGEVDNLVVCNAYENILARKLNLPENPEPYKNVDSSQQPPLPPTPLQRDIPPAQPTLTQQNRTVAQNTRNVLSNPSRPTEQPYPPVQQNRTAPQQYEVPTNSRKLVQQRLPWGNVQSSVQPSLPVRNDQNNTTSSNDIPNEMELMDLEWANEDWETAVELEGNWQNASTQVAQSSNNPPKEALNSARPPAPKATTSYEISSDEEGLFNIDESSLLPRSYNGNSTKQSTNNRNEESEVNQSVKISEEGQLQRKPLFSHHSGGSKGRPTPTSKDTFPEDHLLWGDDSDLLNIDNISALASNSSDGRREAQVDSKNKKGPVQVPSAPFVYLSQVLKSKSSEKFRIKGAVLTILEKLSISGDEWKLSAKVTDGTENLAVRFSAPVLEELIGISASSLRLLKKDMAHQPIKREMVKSRFANAQNRLINLNCLFDIQFCEEDIPLVVGVDYLDPSTLTTLRSRRMME